MYLVYKLKNAMFSNLMSFKEDKKIMSVVSFIFNKWLLYLVFSFLPVNSGYHTFLLSLTSHDICL
jgi:hypothetical protein